MSAQSFAFETGMPSAVLSDGFTVIPIYGVHQLSMQEIFHLPSVGTSTVRAALGTHDDTITLTGVLFGEERYALKFALETLAEAAKRGTALEGLTKGAVAGLVLITSLTVRTDLQIQGLTFSASAGRRDVIDVTVSLMHMPRRGALPRLLEGANLGVQALRDFTT